MSCQRLLSDVDSQNTLLFMLLVMGPASANALPSRPRFSWVTSNHPWTDGVGNQEAYASPVKRWCAYHNSLPDTNGSKVFKASKKIV